MIIRSFRPADQDAARRLILAGLADHFGRIDETLNRDVDDICGTYAEPACAFVVAEVAGRLVGTGGLVTERAGVGRIVRMSVDREHRRKGIGRALVARLAGEAERRAFAEVLVETNNDWLDAIGLYRSCGFVEYDRDDASVHLVLALDGVAKGSM